MTRTDQLLEVIGDIPVTTAERLVRAKSRDFFWYSPILKEKLDHVTADAVVSPRNEDEVAKVLAACWALDIPVTARGAGTGNYGQAMPLAGGIVLDMTAMNRIIEIGEGTIRVEPGILMANCRTLCGSARVRNCACIPRHWKQRPLVGFWPVDPVVSDRSTGACCANPATCWDCV